MILRYTIMYVENVEQTLSFYERAFGLERGMVHESGDYGELVTGETKPDRLREVQSAGITVLYKPVSPRVLRQAILAQRAAAARAVQA